MKFRMRPIVDAAVVWYHLIMSSHHNQHKYLLFPQGTRLNNGCTYQEVGKQKIIIFNIDERKLRMKEVFNGYSLAFKRKQIQRNSHKLF